MNIEEIRQLSDEKLGVNLAHSAGLKVYSGFDGRMFYELLIGQTPVGYQCNILPQDLNAIAEVEKIVISGCGLAEYAEVLAEVCTDGEFSLKPQIPFIVDNGVSGHYSALYKRIGFIAITSARQRSEACLLTLENAK